MAMIKVYLYDKETKEYKGTMDVYEVRGVYPKPMYSTEIQPDLTLLQQNQTYIFNEVFQQWEIVPDYRNTKLWHKQTKEEFTITEINKILNDYPNYTINNPASLNVSLDLIYFNDTLNNWDYEISKCIEYIKNQINIIREKRINEPIIYNSITYDAGQGDIENILNAIDGLQFNNQNQIQWRDYNDNYQTLTLQDLQNIYNLWLLRKNKVYQASFILKDSLPTKTEEEIVNLLDINNLETEFNNIYNGL